MRARDLAEPLPTVQMDTPALAAARLLASHNLPGLIVVDDTGGPVTVLPGTQVLAMAIPAYCQDDPALARVIDERRRMCSCAGSATVPWRSCCRENGGSCRWWTRMPRCWPAVMAGSRAPLVAVADRDGPMLGAITLDTLLDRMLATS